MIKALLLDIDGVLTDGKLTFDAQGNETKTIDFRDLEAAWDFKRMGVKLALITGEGTPIVEIFRKRFAPDHLYKGCKEKVAAVKEILEKENLTLEDILYVGDGKYDIPVMEFVKYSACPANAISDVKAKAKIHLNARGGDGCIRELLDLLRSLE